MAARITSSPDHGWARRQPRPGRISCGPDYIAGPYSLLSISDGRLQHAERGCGRRYLGPSPLPLPIHLRRRLVRGRCYRAGAAFDQRQGKPLACLAFRGRVWCF